MEIALGSCDSCPVPVCFVSGFVFGFGPLLVWFVSGFAIRVRSVLGFATGFVADSYLVGIWVRDRVMSKFVLGSCLGSGACLVRVCFASVSYLASCLDSYSVLFWLVVKVVWFDE